MPTGPARDIAGEVPLPRIAMPGRRPRCGRGPLLSGLLAIRSRCPTCRPGLRAHDAWDGPTAAGTSLVGALAVIAAPMVDLRRRSPVWLHALPWPALVLSLSTAVMREVKALPAALQYRHRRAQT